MKEKGKMRFRDYVGDLGKPEKTDIFLPVTNGRFPMMQKDSAIEYQILKMQNEDINKSIAKVSETDIRIASDISLKLERMALANYRQSETYYSMIGK